MVCFTPLSAYRNSLSKSRKPTVFGKKSKFQPTPASHPHLEFLQVPCGQCSGCRWRRSAEWGTRCLHESKLHRDNCFITLTYNDQNLPADKSINKEDPQKFLKRLRKHFVPKCPIKNVPKSHPSFAQVKKARADWLFKNGLRYYYCGEYGDLLGRPHYHFIIFNLDFSDKKYWRKSKSGEKCFRSDTLESLWPFGNSEIGSVTYESACYVARYITKKMNGELADDHYLRHDPDGRPYWLMPEFTNMSLKPGIGAGWFEKYHTDVFPHDFVVINGKQRKPPKYYDGLYELLDATSLHRMDLIREKRQEAALLHIDNNTPERLNVRRQVFEARNSAFNRNL